MSVTVSIRKRLSPVFSLDVEFETGANSGGSLGSKSSLGSKGSLGSEGCLGILGPSGCGKSMTLKCIAGIETPDEGHISINGRVLFDSTRKINLKPQDRRVGYLFQNYALFPQMTVLENILTGLTRVLPVSKADALKKAHNVIGNFELAGLEKRYPHQLSGGQQQRAALARMLIREPELVLLDEPFSALDAGLREQIQIRFLELLKTRQNVILVTHNRDEVYKLCDETLVMDEGRELAKGKTSALFENPGTVQAARLTGCKNISPVTRTGEREIFALDWGITLRTAAPVEADITHAGIRAHDFRISGGENYNLVRPTIKTSAEEPFERVIVFTNAGARNAAEQGDLWWKYSKYLDIAGMPEMLFIPPEAVLLLRNEH